MIFIWAWSGSDDRGQAINSTIYNSYNCIIIVCCNTMINLIKIYERYNNSLLKFLYISHVLTWIIMLRLKILTKKKTFESVYRL